MESELKIHAVKVNSGYYFTDNIEYSTYHSGYAKDYYFNGELSSPTFHKDWRFIKSFPSQVEVLVSGEAVNKRYELLDPSLASDKIPLWIAFDDAAYYDSDYDLRWYPKYSSLESLYTYKYDPAPDYFKAVPFSFTIIYELDVDAIPDAILFSYPVKIKPGWTEINGTVTNKDAEHQLIDKVLFPSILVHKTPCRLTSKQVYDIVRQHIKQYINPMYAKVTSDYDFCFTVEKNITLATPYTRDVEEYKGNSKSYSPKRYKKLYVNNRTVKIFEMTHSESNYRGYVPISGIIGNDEEDLKNKIDKVLEDVIILINEPLVECPNCQGLGVIFNK
jgi:hypothetical protein